MGLPELVTKSNPRRLGVRNAIPPGIGYTNCMAGNNWIRTLALLTVLALLAAACPGSADQDAQLDTGRTSTTEASLSTNTAVDATEAEPAATVPQAVAPQPDPTLLPLDPDVRIGVLDNGLTYYARSNDSPGSRLDLRLVVRAGSLQQEEPDSGLAHFAEHMLFNGTEAFEGNQLDRVLQGFGLQIGADLNAYTSYGETVYSLSVPTSRDAVATGLEVLFQWASAATLDDQAVIDERGVVREEFRVREESADGVIFSWFSELYTADSGYSGYDPIGTPEQILATTGADTRRFYDRWYRPDLMAIVAVGDVPVDQIEEQIKAVFNELESRSDGQDWTEPTVGEPSGLVVDVVTHPDAGRPAISLDIPIDDWDSLTVGGERLKLIESVIDSAIRSRLERRIDEGALEAILNSSGSFQLYKGRRFLGFNVTGEDLSTATEGLLTELRLIEFKGFTESELAAATASRQAGIDRDRDSVPSFQDAWFAALYVGHFLGDSAIERLEDGFQRESEILENLSLDEVNNHVRFMLQGRAPIIVAVGSDAAELPTTQQLGEALKRAREAELPAQIDPIRTFEQLMAPPSPVEPTNTRRIESMAATEWQFENGARVIFRPSNIYAGNLDVLAFADGGWSTLAEGDAALSALATYAVNRSGLGELSTVELDKFLGATSAWASVGIDETVDVIEGSATVEDAEVLFQLINLLITESKVEPSAFREAVEFGRSQVRQLEADPATRSSEALHGARYGESKWYDFIPSTADLDRLEPADLELLYSMRFGDVDDLVVAVTGDLPAAAVLSLAQEYIGTLPAGPADTWIDRQDAPPDGIERRQVAAGQNGAGAGIDLFYSAEMAVDDRTRLVVEIVQNIVSARLFENVREDLGATYGGRVSSVLVSEPDALVETFVTVTGDPDRLDAIYQTVTEDLAQLGAEGPTEDEFDRAKRIAISDNELINNLDLLNWLHQAADGDALNYTETLTTIRAISRADVAAVAKVMFPLDQRIEIFRSGLG